MRSSSVLWALPLLVLGCSAKDAVSLSAQINDPTVKIDSGVLATSVSGSFEIDFKLGPEASGPTTVSPGNFLLQTSTGTVLAQTLEVSSSPGFPLLIDKGESKTVTITITGPEVDHDSSCAGPVQIVGSVSDTLKGGTDPLRSDAVTPQCG